MAAAGARVGAAWGRRALWFTRSRRQLTAPRDDVVLVAVVVDDDDADDDDEDDDDDEEDDEEDEEGDEEEDDDDDNDEDVAAGTAMVGFVSSSIAPGGGANERAGSYTALSSSSDSLGSGSGLAVTPARPFALLTGDATTLAAAAAFTVGLVLASLSSGSSCTSSAPFAFVFIALSLEPLAVDLATTAGFSATTAAAAAAIGGEL